jgi:hypothetical protein
MRWEKVTKANFAGWYVDLDGFIWRPATPLEYLTRLSLVNEVLGDAITFEGVDEGPAPYELRIRTTQPHVPGDAPSAGTLDEWLVYRGFTRAHDVKGVGAEGSTAWHQGNTWLFDVRPMNFVWLEGSVDLRQSIIPIDVIVQRQAA